MVHVDASRNVSGVDGVRGCMWAGITRLKAELGPGEKRNLDLKAAFTQVRYATCTHVTVGCTMLVCLAASAGHDELSFCVWLAN